MILLASILENCNTKILMSSEQHSPPVPEAVGPDPKFGWSAYAEQTNGRFAMIGFVALLVLELFTRQDLFTWMGLR